MSSLLRKITPLGDRVLVKRILPQQKTAGGLYLPDTAQGKQMEGEVLAVGPGTTNRDGTVVKMTLKVGDKVLLPEYGGHTVEINKEELTLFRHDDIIAKFE